MGFAKGRIYFEKNIFAKEDICDRFYETKLFAIDLAKKRYFRKKVLRKKKVFAIDFAKRFFRSVLRKEGSILQKDIYERRFLQSILRNEGVCDRFGEKKIFLTEGFAKRRYMRSILQKEDFF